MHELKHLKNGLQKFDPVLILVASFLTCWTFFKLPSYLHSTNVDTEFFSSWLHHILQYGRLHSLEASYITYTPPYIYLLSLSSLLSGLVSESVLIRIPGISFMFLASAMAYSICRFFGLSTLRSAIAAWLIIVLPDVVLDSLAWGQCDIIHTAILLAGFRLLIARRDVLAMAAFGIALSFKLQAVFAGPVVLGLLLSGEISWAASLALPAAYLAMMIPAYLAGRPWKQLLGVYTQQYGYYDSLEMNAPNPYILPHHFLYRLSVHTISLVSSTGLMICAACSAAVVLYVYRHGKIAMPAHLATLFGFSLLMEPFLLPRMHERYFFAGELFIFLCAMSAPRFWPVAVLVQITAAITYLHFLRNTPTLSVLATALMAVSLGYLLWHLSCRFPRNAQPAVASVT